MLKNYFKTAFRNLYKTKVLSSLNLFGLSIGIAACLLILHYVYFERSYDNWHDGTENIYRLRYERIMEDGSAARFASCTPPAGVLIRERFPYLDKVGRIFHYQANVSYNNLDYYEGKIFFAEPEFFEIFSFNFKTGNPVKQLNDPDNIFVSQSIAKKYFGDADPIGKTISLDRKHDMQVVGVFDDVPANSHIKFDFIFPHSKLLQLYGDDYHQNWGHTGMYTYVKLNPETKIETVRDDIAELIEKEFGEALAQYKMEMLLPLQPIRDIHLHSNFMQEYEPGGNQDSVNFLFIIAVFIIVMAWINYINLTTARSLTRAKEVGLRKVVGASKVQLGIQFIVETALLNVYAIVTSAMIIVLSLPLFNDITGMSSTIVIWRQEWFLPSIIILLAIGTLASGIYPAVVLSSFKPSSILRGKFGNSSGGINLRKGLVVFQFAVAFILVTSTLTVYKQLTFMQNQDLGFDVEQTLVIKAPRHREGEYGTKVQTLKEVLLSDAAIDKICHVTEVPGRQLYWDAGGIYKVGDDATDSKNYHIVGIDYDFIDFFDMQLVNGRNFAKEFPADTSSLMMNEAAAAYMGFESSEAAVGKEVSYWGEIFKVVGVVKNYHQQSLRKDYEPLLYRLMPEGRGVRGQIVLKFNAQNVKQVVEAADKMYAKFFPGNPFDFFFLDEYFDQQYRADFIFGEVVGIFALLAIIITALGIFGLSSYNAIQKTKEIGIRKVLGAEVSKIVYMLSKEFVILMLIAFAISVPLLVYGLNKFLSDFAFRIEMSLIIFILPMVGVATISLISIGYQYLKAATMNPAKALRHE